MTDFGFAYVNRGWALTPDGQLLRASTAADLCARLLRPFFGAVVGEAYRGNAQRDTLKKVGDAAPVIVADRFRLLLRPLTRDGVVRDLAVSAAVETTNPEYVRVQGTATDQDRNPVRLDEFVRIA